MGARPDTPPRSTFGESYGGVLGVDGVEDALVADLRLGDKADLAAGERGAPTPGATPAMAAPSEADLTPLRTPACSVGTYSSHLRPSTFL